MVRLEITRGTWVSAEAYLTQASINEERRAEEREKLWRQKNLSHYNPEEDADPTKPKRGRPSKKLPPGTASSNYSPSKPREGNHYILKGNNLI